MLKRILSYFESVEVPENHVTCPNCNGFGAEDVFLNCDFCNGDGHVDKDIAKLYKED